MKKVISNIEPSAMVVNMIPKASMHATFCTPSVQITINDAEIIGTLLLNGIDSIIPAQLKDDYMVDSIHLISINNHSQCDIRLPRPDDAKVVGKIPLH